MTDVSSPNGAIVNANANKKKAKAQLRKKSAWANPRVWLLILVGLLILWLTVGKDVIHKHDALEHQAQTMNQQVLTIKLDNEEASQVLSDPLLWSSELSSVEAALPASRQFPALINTISRVAAQAGVKWSQGSTVPNFSAAPGAPASSFTTSITIAGPDASIKTFINDIQSTTRKISVQTFTLTQYNTNAPDTVTIKLNVWGWGGPTGTNYGAFLTHVKSP